MEKLLNYQLEVSVCLIVFYSFYKLLLRKETDFVFRRFYLITSSIISFLLPALNIRFTLKTNEIPAEYLNFIPQQMINFSPQTAPVINLTPELVIAWIWLTGLTFMVLRFISSIYYVHKIVKKSKPQSEYNKVRLAMDDIQSFSFFKTIVLSKSHFQSQSVKYILAHEQAHSDQYHSYDVVIMEILKSLQWFNPAAWLLARETTQNLEYLADRKVIRAVGGKKEYQMAIVQFARQQKSKSPRSEFSKTNLKNRIMMINQPNNQKIKAWKSMLLLPVVGALFMSFSVIPENPELKKEILPILTESANLSLLSKNIVGLGFQKDSVYHIVDTPPEPISGSLNYNEALLKNLNYPEKSKTQGVEGSVFVQFFVRKDGKISDVTVVKGIAADCDHEAVRLIKEGPGWIPGQHNGKNVSVRMIWPVTFSLSDHDKNRAKIENNKSIARGVSQTKSADQKADPSFMVNEKEISKEEFDVLNPESIESISVLKGADAKTSDEESAKNGIIKINMKSSYSTDDNVKYQLKISDAAINPIAIRLHPETESVTEGETGIKIRGIDTNSIFKNNPPLIFKDGVEISTKELSNINSYSIKSIEVIKEEEAIKTYGDKGKNGVILITIE
jgi:TonB family protein